MRPILRLAAFHAALLAFCLVVPRPAAAQSGAIGVRGDVNRDGAVTAGDALAVLSEVVGKTLPAGYTVASDGDADGNGQVTALDALVILSHVVGKDVPHYLVGRRLLSKRVGAGGGAVVSRGDSIRLEVPEGALSEAVVLMVEPAPALAEAPGVVPGSALELGPDGQGFARPVRLTLRIDPGALPQGTGLEEMRIHRRVGDGWEEVPGGVVDTQAGTVSASLSGFSAYAVLARGAGLSLVKEDGDDQTGTVGQPPHGFLVARVLTPGGQGVPNQTLSWSVIEGGGSVRPLEARTDSAGRLRAVFTLGPAPGPNRVQVSGARMAPVVFNAQATAAAPASVAVVAGADQTAVAGSAVAAPPSVRVRDSGGNPVADVEVTFAVASGGGSVTGATPRTDADGVATLGGWTLGTTAGTNTLTASVAAGPSATITATGLPGPAASIAIEAGDGGSAPVAGTHTLAAKVTDAHGNGVPGATVQWTVASGGGSLSAASSATGGAGVASTVWTLGTGVGAQGATAELSGVAGSPLTFSVNAVPGAAAKLVLTRQPADARSGVALGTQPTVQLEDAYGNAVPQAGVAVAAAVASGGGTLGGTATVATDAAGSAAFADLAITGTVGDRTLEFTATGMTGVVSDVVALAAGPPASLAVEAGEGQTAAAGTGVSTAPSVRVADASGNPVSGVVVEFAVAGGGGSVAGETQTTGADGIATVGGWTLGTAAGANTLTATATGLPAATFTATGVAGPAATIAVQSGDGGTAVVASTRTLEARVVDAHGNPVQGHTVSWAVAPGGGSVGAPSSTTDAAGVATVVWTLGTGAGAQGATATAAGLAGSPLTFAATATAAAASAGSSTLAASPGSITADGTSTATLTVQLRDVYGNPLSAGAGSVALGTTGGTLSAVTDNGDGSYTATLTAPTATGTATVSGTLDGAALGNTETVSFVPGAPARYEVSASAATAVAGEPVTVTARLVDAHGNAVPAAGRTVAWSSTDGGSFAAPTSATDADGTATVVFTTSAAAGTSHTVTADDGAVSGTSGAVLTEVGAPAAITKLGADGVSLAAGSAVTPLPGVRVTDARGNGIPGVEVTFAVTSGGGTITGATQTTSSAGEATVESWTLGTTAGANTLGATAGALSASFTVTGTVGPASPAGTQITTVNPALTAGSITSVVVQVKDQHGNDVTTGGAVVALATDLGTLGPVTDNGDGSYTADLTHAGANGVATVTGTLGGVAIADDATVTFQAGGIERTWTGLAGSGWNTAGSWSPRGTPAALDTIVINGGGTQPQVTDADKTIERLVMTSAGGTLDLGGFKLVVTGDAVVTGGAVRNGTVEMSGSARTLAGTVPSLLVTGSVTTGGGVTANGAVRVVNGALTVGNQTLTIRGP
ncbi:MAG TPA: invasin domain 3-containing protein [Longimicrobiaceae bacterium]|nr:invasin domain 3-containing protein [Longimicrobiaceae bacterium]